MKKTKYDRTNIRRVRKERKSQVPVLLTIGGLILGFVAVWAIWVRNVHG